MINIIKFTKKGLRWFNLLTLVLVFVGSLFLTFSMGPIRENSDQNVDNVKSQSGLHMGIVGGPNLSIGQNNKINFNADNGLTMNGKSAYFVFNKPYLANWGFWLFVIGSFLQIVISILQFFKKFEINN